MTYNENVTYKFRANDTIGYPDKIINFAFSEVKRNDAFETAGISLCDVEKFSKIYTMFDMVRLKGMSVKISYISSTGSGAQTLNFNLAIDRSGAANEVANNHYFATVNEQANKWYKDRIDNASSKRKYSLTGGKSIYLYLRPYTAQEKMFTRIANDNGTEGIHPRIYYLYGACGEGYNGFNPCIYSYIEKSAEASTTETNILLNVEIKYYVEFRNSI